MIAFPSRNSVCVFLITCLFFVSGILYAQKGGATAGQPQSAGGAGGQSGATPYFETEMLAYGGVNQLSESVAQKVCNGGVLPQPGPNQPSPTIIIYDPTSFQNLGAWQSLVAGASALENTYETLMSPDEQSLLEARVPAVGEKRRAMVAATTPGSFLLGGADLGSLITSIAASTTNNASTFTIPDSSMAVSLMHAFKRVNCNVTLIYYPLFGSYADISTASSKVSDAFTELNEVRSFVQNAVFNDANANSNISPKYLILQDLNTQYDTLLKNVLSLPGQSSGAGGNSAQSSTPQGSGQASGATVTSASPASSGYTSLVQGAELEDLIQRDSTYILYADVVAAGGTQRDLKNVFTLLTGDWLSYSGGLIVNVALIKSKETSLELADTLRYRSDFTNPIGIGFLGLKSFSGPRDSRLVESPNAGENTLSLCNEEKPHHFWSKRPSALDCAVVGEKISVLSFDRTELTGGVQFVGAIARSGTDTRNDGSLQLCTTDSKVSFPDSTTVPQPKGTDAKELAIISAGSTTASFPVFASAVGTQEKVDITVISSTGDCLNPKETVLGKVTLTLDPPVLKALSVSPSEVPGLMGQTALGTVTLNGVAPSGGTDIQVTSNTPSVTIKPNLVTVESTKTEGLFTVTAPEVYEDTLVRISGTASEQKIPQSAILKINASAPRIDSIAISNLQGTSFTITIHGGNLDPKTAQVMLSGPGCPPASPCVIKNSDLTTQAISTLSGATKTAAPGTFNVQVKNMKSGLSSNADKSITVSAKP